MIFSTFLPLYLYAELTFSRKKKRSVRLRDASQPLNSPAWHEFIDSNTVNSMVWETRTSLAAWFQEGQCQLFLDNLHVELGLFSPSSNYTNRFSRLKLPASSIASWSTLTGSAGSQGSEDEMVTLSRVPNLLPPRPSQDDGTLAKANSLK